MRGRLLVRMNEANRDPCASDPTIAIREARGFRACDELRAYIRYAFRTLRNNPGFGGIAVLSLVLGIGVNLSCFASLYIPWSSTPFHIRT